MSHICIFTPNGLEQGVNRFLVILYRYDYLVVFWYVMIVFQFLE